MARLPAVLLATWAAGGMACAHEATPAPPAVPEVVIPRAEPPSPADARVADDERSRGAPASPLAWARRMCPAGTTAGGGVPPLEFEVWCALPGGTKHGPFMAFYDNGQAYLRGAYVTGRLHGVVQSWRADGSRWLETDYEHGLRTRSIAWNEDGTLAWDEPRP